MTYVYYDHREYVLGEYHITITCIPSELGRFFGLRNKTKTFIGSQTVWFDISKWKKASKNMEYVMSCFYARIKMLERNEKELNTWYPDSYLSIR